MDYRRERVANWGSTFSGIWFSSWESRCPFSPISYLHHLHHRSLFSLISDLHQRLSCSPISNLHRRTTLSRYYLKVRMTMGKMMMAEPWLGRGENLDIPRWVLIERTRSGFSS
ncbi:hypothetical protein SLEP1_g25084 [Rubroshorea leprosula]|uniref:Uncharacterized protein n=1 Tax=Rubroshorea leprosula TaxID=152421 RepID=A0AAV5JNY6_9ROSI|nr:hypothetical protein SLEP1_g25084 [Rubroshorea leprosula]